MPQLPDDSPLPGTRAELLIAQRDRVKALEKSYFRGAVLVPGRGRRMCAELDLWRDIDRTPEARALPPGNIQAELETIHDARDSPELESVIRESSFRKQVRITSLDLVGVVMVAVIPFMIGLVIALLALAVGSVGAKVALVLAGLLVMLPAGVLWWAASAESFRRQQEFNTVGIESTLYRARRKALTGFEPRAQPSLPLWARPAAGVIGGLILVTLLLRIRRSDPIILVITAAIVVVLALLPIVPLWRRRSLHVIPLLAGGRTVLDKPTRWVSIEVDDAGLRISPTKAGIEPVTIAVSEVIGVIPVKIGYPFAAEAIGILTREAPIVLSGSGISDEPAILMLRKQFG